MAKILIDTGIFMALFDSDFHIYRINGYPFRIVVEYEKKMGFLQDIHTI